MVLKLAGMAESTISALRGFPNGSESRKKSFKIRKSNMVLGIPNWSSVHRGMWRWLSRNGLIQQFVLIFQALSSVVLPLILGKLEKLLDIFRRALIATRITIKSDGMGDVWGKLREKSLGWGRYAH
jgi:hypothetical protein